MADADGTEDNVCDDTIHPDQESDGQTNISTLHQAREYDDTKIGQSTEEGGATKECTDLNTSETRKDEATDKVTDNEVKEDDKSINKPALKQTQNKEVVSDQNKLKEKLKGEGLDPEFWSNKLKSKLGITCCESLAHVSPKDLKKLGPFNYDWEKAALLKLVHNGADDNSNTEVKKVVKKIKSKIKPDNNFEETAKTKLEPLRTATTIPDGDWVREKKQVNFKEALSSIQPVTETQPITRTEFDDNTVIKRVSGGRALMGIYFKQNLDDITELKKTVIQLCGDITMKGPSIKPEEQFVEFTSREKRDTFNKALDTTGKNGKIAVNVGVKDFGLKMQSSGTSLKDADHTQMENGEEIFYSKEKHAFVPVKSCELKLEHIRLTPDAVDNLVNIESQFNKHIDCGTGLRLCVDFFENYGSHVNIGILHFGGIFTWTATYTSETKSEKFSSREIVHDALDGFISLGIVGKVCNFGAGISGSYLSSRSNIENKYTESELSHILLKIVPDGGPPDEGDFNKWKHTLVSQNSTWSLVDRDNFCGLWDVLKNHQTDFENCKTLSVLLECAWNMEIVKNNMKNVEHTSYISILKMLCQTIERLTDLTDTEEFVKTFIQTNNDVLEFFDYIASSPDLQENINIQGIKHILSFVLNPLRDVFFPGKPNLGAWISQEIRNLDDFQSVLSIEEIISIDNLISVLKSKFLPQMRTTDVTNRNRNQQTVETYITKEFTQVCQKLLRTFDTANDKAQFAILFSLLQKFRYEDKKGFSRLLALSDIEEFVLEVEPCMNKYNQTNKDTDIQNQALLVDFIVSNIKQYKWDLSEKMFDICLKKLLPILNDGVKHIINIYTESLPYNWDQLQCDLQPLKKGNEAQEFVFSLPVEKILNMKVGNCEKPAMSDSHCHNLSNELKELLDKLQMFEYLPDKLKFAEAITIHSRRTLNGLKGLPWFLLETIMVQNSSIYDELEKYMNDNLSPQPHVYDDDPDDAGDDNDKDACDGDFDFFNCLSEEPKESMLINPLDLIVTVFRCCSQPLKQALVAKMYTCRLAIPILLPQEPLVFSFSILRSIFINTQGAPPMIAVDYPCNVLSFIRIGRPKYSKSRLINTFLCKQYHDTFFNQGVPLGGTDRRISNGLVETTFLIGSKSERGIQRQNVTMVFNLRGNATRYEKQRDMLSGISSGIVIMTTCEELKDGEMLEYVQNLCTHIKVVIALDAISDTKEEVKEIMKPYMPSSQSEIKHISFVILALKGKVRGSSDINKELRKALQTTIEALPLKSISQRTDNSATQYVDDNHVHLNERTAAETMMTNLSGDMAFVKKEALPLQLDLLCVLSQNMKKMYKPSQYKTQKHKLEIRQEILKTRREQLKLIPDLHPLMISFLHNMLDRLDLDTGYEMFALWVKSFLEIKSRDYQLGMQACNTNTVLGKSDTSSTDILFGFEHLIRELGQLYEAIVEQPSMVDSKTYEVARKFPLIPAKLLMMGLPFELMNGDISHVPIVWVKAVLKELEHLVGIKRSLILSVVGTQSSGKSTLLNAMFGLQFPVGHGRITKGAFMQLIPVIDEQLSYEYILVIDTEGLRAPELGEHNYIHDTEFASFIIGLADINIVNIMGEHSLEMNDVLQMVVHTLLRLKLSQKLNLKQSCVFVHQNVISDDADNALDSTLQQFVKTLNKKTEEAANELDISDIHTFTDVIDFNVKHVWYLPPLVTGSLPMVHTSPNYSLKAAEIRKVLLYDIIPPDKACFTISETSLRIENIWNGILMENFASEFRNALEVKAFASLDEKYHELQWQLELFMFEFVQEKKCELAKLKYERESQDIVQKILETIQEVLHSRSEIMINDLQTFISRNTLKNVMIKWEQTYILRIPSCLQSLAMKAERGLRLIIEELEHVSKYNDIIKDCKSRVNVLASELADQVRNKYINDRDREDKFNNAWMIWLAEFSTKSKHEAGSVGDQVRYIVKDRNLSNTTLMTRLDTLTDEECMHMTILQGAVKEDDIKDNVHINRYKQISGYICKETFRVCRSQAISMTSKLFRQIENYIYELKLQDTRFQDIYMKKILNMVDETIKEHNKHKNNDHQFKVLPPFKALVLTHITGYCIKMFVMLDNRYELEHSPRAKLEKYKETAWMLFNNLIDSKNSAVIAAGFFHEAIEEAVLEYLGECLPGEVENEVLKIFKHSKYELMKSVMKDLAIKDVFHYFIMFISEAEIFVQQWLINYTNEMLFGESEDGQRGYDKLSKPKVEMVFADIRKSVIYASREVEGKQGNIIPQWTKCFISKTCVLPISEDKLVHMQDRIVTNDFVQNFQRAILNHVEKIENTIRTKIRETKTENICWKRSPYSCIFERLWGCCETCPFCNEPCEYTDKDHLSSVKHSCRSHRPQGFADFAWQEGKGSLMIETCNYLIQTGNCYSLQGSTETHKYRHYRKKYPEWEISPSGEISKYWMWFYNKYKNEMAQMNKAKPPQIAKELEKIDKREAVDSL